jgi:hypothetical protein
MPATYFRHGEGRSLNGRAAEADGKMPLTRAAAHVAEEAQISQSSARKLLLAMQPCEWHHVGKYAAEVDYYDTGAALRLLSGNPDDYEDTEQAIAVAAQIRDRMDRERAAWQRVERRRQTLAAKKEAERQGFERRQAEQQRAYGAAMLAREAARTAERERQIALLKERYAADPTDGRREALRNYGIDPATIQSV